jgi:ATP phosphoribosyltransferase regulatory subunit
MSGYAYYSGARFALYGDGSPDALARGGRYDEIGSVFGRNRPAVGFSVVDLKELARLLSSHARPAAIRARWSEHADVRAVVRRLRESGETVVWELPGEPPASDQGLLVDRELVEVGGRWMVKGC